MVRTEPAGFVSVVASLCPVILLIRKTVINRRNDPRSRIPVYLAERMELLQSDPCQPGFFFQLPGSRLFQRFIHFHKSAGKGPHPFERFVPSFDQQNLQLIPSLPENGNISRNRRTRILIAIAHNYSSKFTVHRSLFTVHRPKVDNFSL